MVHDLMGACVLKNVESDRFDAQLTDRSGESSGPGAMRRSKVAKISQLLRGDSLLCPALRRSLGHG
jgi:hypothetical protein